MFGISNPQALLRPWRDLRQFSEELYAMMVSKAPVETDSPVTIRVRDGQTGLRLTRPSAETASPSPVPQRVRPADPELARPRPPASSPTRTPPRSVEPTPVEPESPRSQTPVPTPVPTTSTSQAAPDRPSRPQAARGQDGDRGRDARRVQPESRPILEVEGPARFSGPEPTRFDVPPQVYDPRKREWYTPPAFKLPDDPSFFLPIGGGNGTTTFIGKVVSGTGDTYQVALYPDGHLSVAGDTVEVVIPMIDPDETIDPDTWLYGIFQFTDTDGNETYSCQPPVWMS